MFGSVRLARAFGIDLKVHATFFLVLVLGAMQWASFGVRGAAFGVLSTLVLFACVTLHELGHALVARRFDIPVNTITLMPFGGIAQMTKKPAKPGHELLISLAGPMVNVVIAVALAALGFAWLGPQGSLSAMSSIGRSAPTLTTLWAVVLGSNVMLAAFNLIPALPMDGGRVFRALLSYPLGGPRATRVSSVVGRVLAAGMFALGLYAGQVMLTIIGVFIFFAAGAEARSEAMSTSLADVTAGQAVNTRAVHLAPNSTLGEALSAVHPGQTAFAVLHFGRLVGVVTRNDLVAAIQAQGPFAYVAGAMRRQVPAVSPTDTLERVRERMNADASPAAAVVDAEGNFVGLISEVELAHQLMLAQALGGKGPKGRPGSRSRERFV